jgi:hypothetical protein
VCKLLALTDREIKIEIEDTKKISDYGDELKLLTRKK